MWMLPLVIGIGAASAGSTAKAESAARRRADLTSPARREECGVIFYPL